MQVFLIRESNKNSILKKMLKVIEIKQNVIILNFKIKNKNANSKIKIIKKIKKVLDYYNCKKVILSKNLKQDETFKYLLQHSHIQIINGENLIKRLLNKIIEKASIENNIKPENSQITIMSNNLENWLECLIDNISTKYKLLGIVTDNISYFRKLETKLLEKEGTIITITNNKKKSLCKSNIIINLELNEEQINKYVIYEKSIVISLKGKMKIYKKRFNGKIISDFEIELKNNSKIYRDLLKKEYMYYDIIDLAEIYIINNEKEIRNISIKFLKK